MRRSLSSAGAALAGTAASLCSSCSAPHRGESPRQGASQSSGGAGQEEEEEEEDRVRRWNGRINEEEEAKVEPCLDWHV